MYYIGTKHKQLYRLDEIFLILRLIFIQYEPWKRRNNHHYIANSSHRFSVDMRIVMWVQDKIERKARDKCTFLSQRVVYLSNKTIFPIQVNFFLYFHFSSLCFCCFMRFEAEESLFDTVDSLKMVMRNC